jgi:ABC-type transport system involved in cytochrome bd biosynthesis fused ATPase/permease subunit
MIKKVCEHYYENWFLYLSYGGMIAFLVVASVYFYLVPIERTSSLWIAFDFTVLIVILTAFLYLLARPIIARENKEREQMRQRREEVLQKYLKPVKPKED